MSNKDFETWFEKEFNFSTNATRTVIDTCKEVARFAWMAGYEQAIEDYGEGIHCYEGG